MTIEDAIEHAEEVAEMNQAIADNTESENWMDVVQCEKCAAEHRQLAEWLRILKKAKFEYDEAWRIITHPTPDVTYADRNRAQTILNVFRGSLGRME